MTPASRLIPFGPQLVRKSPSGRKIKTSTSSSMPAAISKWVDVQIKQLFADTECQAADYCPRRLPKPPIARARKPLRVKSRPMVGSENVIGAIT